MITQRDIDNEINTLTTILQEGSFDEDYEYNLRCSSLPWCGLHELKYGGKRKNSFKMDFYTSIGTAVHETIQKWISLHPNYAKDVYAKWVCEECKYDHGECWFPVKCSKCNSKKFEYHEVEIKFGSLTGHVDLIRRVKGNKVVIYDFKTKTLNKEDKFKKINWSKSDDEISYNPKYKIQIETYCYLIRKIKKLDVRGWCLIFVDRADPISDLNRPKTVFREWTPKLHTKYKNRVQLFKDQYEIYSDLKEAIENEDTESARDFLKELIDLRPCKTVKDHDNLMAVNFAYERTKMCPSLRTCTCLKDTVIYKSVLKALADKGN